MPRWMLFAEYLVAGVSVVVDAGHADENARRRPQIRDRGGEGAGTADPARKDAALLHVSPDAEDALARKVDDGVDSLQRVGVDPAVVGIPADLPRRPRLAADEREHFPTVTGERLAQRTAEESAGTCNRYACGHYA